MYILSALGPPTTTNSTHCQAPMLGSDDFLDNSAHSAVQEALAGLQRASLVPSARRICLYTALDRDLGLALKLGRALTFSVDQ